MNKKLYLIISLAVLLIIIIFTGVFSWFSIYIPKAPGSQQTIIFSVEKGQGSKEISANLEKQGLIKNSATFRLYVLFKGFSGKLRAGDYSLSPAMTVPEIVLKIVSGDVIKEKITIIEGWNLRDIKQYFEERGIRKNEDFYLLTGVPIGGYLLPLENDFSQEYDFLEDKSKSLSLEGYLFPDTYEISPEDDTGTIIRKMLDNFGKKLTQDLKEEISRQKKSILEIITMASLIEKEVRTLEDKKIVSGILWKRLKIGMPLQVDATIVYLTDKKSTKISIEETKIDSPYNTYKYKGLPAGPISNPGEESIKAAIYPQESEYWYYLSAPDGKTIFSKTLKEHNTAIQKYLSL